MAGKFFVVVRLLVCGIITAGVALGEAAVNNGSTGIKFNLLGVQVTLYCTSDGNANGIFGAQTPPFRGAIVLLQCGNGEIVANATTNSYGISYLVTNPVPVFPYAQPTSSCKLLVNTTLSTCNSRLPSTGGLESPIDFIGDIILGYLKITNFITAGFHYVN